MKPCNCTINKTKPSVVNRQVPTNKSNKELERWLSGKACTALAEDRISVPITHVRQLTLLLTPAPGHPMPSSGLHTGICTHYT